jgi:hypothetical protein
VITVGFHVQMPRTPTGVRVDDHTLLIRVVGERRTGLRVDESGVAVVHHLSGQADGEHVADLPVREPDPVGDHNLGKEP